LDTGIWSGIIIKHINKNISYENSGVSYKKNDPVKKLAQQLAKTTSKNLKNINEKEIKESRGESAYVWDCGDHYRAFVIEGLGTKNLVADEMEKITGKSYYQSIAQDTVAAIINDLITVGASPEVVNALFSVGDSSWFNNSRRIKDLVKGWKKACDIAGAAWGGGETPTYTGIINPETIDLGGAAVGIIKPKTNLILGQKLKSGDLIILFESSGIHANGLTLARQIAKKLKKGFVTKMPSNKLFGEAILNPTIIYAKIVESLLKNKVNIHYMVNITGHGWRKIMRSSKNFSYIIENIPEPQEEFSFLQEKGPISDKEAYGNFNMGAGFAIFINPNDWNKVEQIANKHKIKVYKSGYIKKGIKKVEIIPKQITFQEKSLNLR